MFGKFLSELGYSPRYESVCFDKLNVFLLNLAKPYSGKSSVGVVIAVYRSGLLSLNMGILLLAS